MPTTEATTVLLPTRDRIVVERIDPSDVSEGGILLPQAAKESTSREGTILAAGPGGTTDEGKLIPMKLRAGDHVVFSHYSGTEVREGRRYLLIMSEEDVLAIVQGP